MMRSGSVRIFVRRGFATAAAQAPSQPRPYSEVPGPRAMPIVGNKFRFLPGFQKYDFSNLVTLHKQLRDEFGDIVRFNGLEPRRDLVFIYSPEDMETMFRNDGAWPERPSFQSLLYYRNKTKKDVFKGVGGVLVDQGPKWQEARTHVNPIMMKTQVVHMYAPKIGQVADDFVNLIPGWRDEKNEMPDSFKNEIHKWALLRVYDIYFCIIILIIFLKNYLAIALVALDARLGCLESRNLAPGSEPQRMIDSVHDLLECIHTLEIGNSTLWRFISTPVWKKFTATLDFFTEVSLKYVNEAIDRSKSRQSVDENELSVLERFLKRDPDPTRSVVMALDMLMAGVDTTSHALTNLLLYLSANQDKQEKLFEELKKILPSPKTEITHEMLDEMKYLRSCIKESMRLMPVVTGNARTTQTDVVLSNYHIPKGVDVIMANALISRSAKYFQNADKFIPERWIRGGDQNEKTNPFVSLPFGHGARKCVGMRFASLELELVAAKLIRRFKWNYNYGEMTYRTYMVHVPSDPQKFQVTDRTD